MDSKTILRAKRLNCTTNTGAVSCIDVVIPTHCASNHLKRALIGVANQTLPPSRTIVVVDGDSNLLDAVRRICVAVGEFNVVPNTRLRGANGARNTGLLLAQSPYVALLDSDDVWEPSKLEVDAQVINDSKADIVCSRTRMQLDDGGSVIHVDPCKGDISQSRGVEILFKGGNSGAGLQTSTLVVRRAFAAKILFDELISFHQDWDFIFRSDEAAASYATSDRILVTKYVTHGSISSRISCWGSVAFFIKRRRFISLTHWSGIYGKSIPRRAVDTRDWLGIILFSPCALLLNPRWVTTVLLRRLRRILTTQH